MDQLKIANNKQKSTISVFQKKPEPDFLKWNVFLISSMYVLRCCCLFTIYLEQQTPGHFIWSILYDCNDIDNVIFCNFSFILYFFTHRFEAFENECKWYWTFSACHLHYTPLFSFYWLIHLKSGFGSVKICCGLIGFDGLKKAKQTIILRSKAMFDRCGFVCWDFWFKWEWKRERESLI